MPNSITSEPGYVAFSKIGAEFIAPFLSGRYEHANIIITTHLEFAEWTTFFGMTK
nr:ATP-binding protein [Sporosarcina psychrophila]